MSIRQKPRKYILETRQPGNVAVIIVVAVLILLIGIGGYYFALQKVQSGISQNKQKQRSSNLQRTDETDNWVKYTDYGLGFSISYPQDDYYLHGSQGPSYSGIYGVELESKKDGYSIYFAVGPASDSLNQYYDSGNGRDIFNQGFFTSGKQNLSENDEVNQVTFSNKQIMFEAKSEEFNSAYYTTEKAYVTISRNNVYKIMVYYKHPEAALPLDKNSQKTYQQILDTFKIL